MRVETTFLTADVMKAALAFGVSELKSKNKCINTIKNPCLFRQYTEDAWKID